MTTYTIASIKRTETIDGTLTEAIERAKAIDAEYQPAFGVKVEQDGTAAWDSEANTEYTYRTDGESGVLDAVDFAAAKQLLDELVGPYGDDGAWGWVEDEDGERYYVARENMP